MRTRCTGVQQIGTFEASRSREVEHLCRRFRATYASDPESEERQITAELQERRSGAELVGREEELAALLSAVDEAASGSGSVVLLSGEPGIGKSRLADEVMRRARARGYRGLWGRAWEDAGAPAYWPWVQALGSYVRSTDADTLRAQLGTGASDVAHLLPELRDLFPDLIGPPPESDSARFQLFDSIARFLRSASGETPVVIVLDDLHAADIPSLLLLKFIAAQTGEMRVLVLATYRDIELAPDDAMTAALMEVSRAPTTRTLRLAGLARRDAAQFVALTAGATPHEAISAAVWRETNGNPLFMRETVRLLSTEGRLQDLQDAGTISLVVPASVRDVIARRIAHLTEPAAQLLRTAALIGPEFAVTLLARVGDLDPQAVLDLLDEAVDAGLLNLVIGGAARYRFAHDLVREGLYAELSAGHRARMHRRVAEALEEMQEAGDETHLAELAFHLHHAAQSGLFTGDDGASIGSRAVEYARRAGDRARSSLAYEEAARLYEMGVDVLRQGEGDPQLELELLLSIGDAVARAGDFAQSRTRYLEAASIARRTGAVSEFARAALGFSGRLPWLRPGNDTLLIPLLQEGLVLLGGSNDRLRVRLLARLACAWRSSPEQHEQAAALAREALALARGLDDAPTLSYALAGQYWATWGPGHNEDRERLAREMIEVAEATGDGERLVDAHVMLGMVHAGNGRMADVRREMDAVLQAVQALRQPAHRWLGTSIRALYALMEGAFDIAEALVAEEMAAPVATHIRDEQSAARMHLFLLRRDQGRVAEAEPFVRAAVEEYPWYPVHRAALALLLIETSREDEARAVFAGLARDDFKALYRDNEWLLGMSMASEACHLLGDERSAKIAYGQLTPFAGLHAIGANEGSVGAIDRYLGLLAAAFGDEDAAVAHLAEGIRLNDLWGARPWAERSRANLAAALRRRDAPGDAQQASELERTALDGASRLGMAVLARQLGAVAAAGRPEGESRSDAQPSTFRRRGEYWTLAFGAEHVELRDSKGMAYLARLLSDPGREFHALDLARGAVGPPRGIGQPPPGELRLEGSAGESPLIDAEARAAYRQRLEDLADELREAEEWNDPERAARARGEIEFLEDEMRGAAGLGGRQRTTASAAERARISVTRALRSAIDRIASQAPALGEHLAVTIRTGTFCSYRPDPRVHIDWRL